MAECSICSKGEGAEIVNELLLAKKGLDVIAQQTGFHRSSVFRHKQKCFTLWRAARVKARMRKNLGTPGRVIVIWPSGEITDGGVAIAEAYLRESDTLLIVEYETPRHRDVTARLVAEAEAEDLQRTQDIAANEKNTL